MVPTQHRIRLLRACEHSPRTLKDFNVGEVTATVLSRHNENWLNSLCAEGLLVQEGESFITTPAGSAELQRLTAPPTTASGRQFGYGSTTGIYTGPRWNVRAGSEVHKSLPSLGFFKA